MIYDKQQFVWFCCLLILSVVYSFANGYLLYLFFVPKNIAVQYRSNVKWWYLI